MSKRRTLLLFGAGVAAVAAAIWLRPAPQAPRPSIVLVPPGTFRASTQCDDGFERGCELMYQHPGKPRWRVIVWLDAFVADGDLVTSLEYEVCRAVGPCKGRSVIRPARVCGSHLAAVAFADARAYCAWRGWRLPTADEFERMGRWVDGRQHAGGDTGRDCDRRASPEGIRGLNMVGQWVSSPAGAAGEVGWSTSNVDFRPYGDGHLAFRCVRSLRPGPNPGIGMPWPTQDDPWVLGGPDG